MAIWVGVLTRLVSGGSCKAMQDVLRNTKVRIPCFAKVSLKSILRLSGGVLKAGSRSESGSVLDELVISGQIKSTVVE